MEEKQYTLPRDWWGVKNWLDWIYLLVFVGLYKLFTFMVSDLSSGIKYGFQEIWSLIISVVFVGVILFFIIRIVFNLLKKTTLKFTSKELIVNNKERLIWKDIKGYKKTENSITLIDSKDIPSRFYTGNLTYYIEEDLKKFIKEIIEKK